MELALQVLGLKLTGKVEDAKNVALRIVGNSASEGNPGVDTSNIMQLSGGPQTQSTVMKILSVLDVAVSGAATVQVTDVISLQTAGGQSLLHLAVILGFTEVVEFLIEHRIDIDLRDKNGYTALHFAAIGRAVTCARRLLSAGADTDIVDARGRTARDVAPEHFFRGLRVNTYHSAASRALSEEEAELGDNEDESDGERIVLSKRRNRRKSSLIPMDRPARESDQDTVVPSPSPPPPPAPPAAEPAVDEKRSLLAYAEFLQRTLAHLSTDKLSLATVPQLLVPFIPGLPVFPVLVPMPAWPAFLDKRTASTDALNAPRPASSVAGAMRAAQEWLAVWEKLRVYGAEAEHIPPPPVYTPRESPPEPVSAEPATCGPSAPALEARLERAAVQLEASPEAATKAAAPSREHRVSHKQAAKPVQKREFLVHACQWRGLTVCPEDRMLFLFWLPMLFGTSYRDLSWLR
jgi:hypothetical protein